MLVEGNIIEDAADEFGQRRLAVLDGLPSEGPCHRARRHDLKGMTGAVKACALLRAASIETRFDLLRCHRPTAALRETALQDVTAQRVENLRVRSCVLDDGCSGRKASNR
jgi:hypothetical protein